MGIIHQKWPSPQNGPPSRIVISIESGTCRGKFCTDIDDQFLDAADFFFDAVECPYNIILLSPLIVVRRPAGA